MTPGSTATWAAPYAEVGLLDAAIAAYREALRLDPDHPAACANLGRALCDSGDWAGGRAEFAEVRRIFAERLAKHTDDEV